MVVKVTIPCNTLTGRFNVREVVYDTGTDEVLSFAADFEQHCEGAKPALRGSIRYNSDDTYPIDVGGKVKGVNVRNALCINKTTGKRVKFPLSNDKNQFDCTRAGLITNPRDIVRIIINGNVKQKLLPMDESVMD